MIQLAKSRKCQQLDYKQQNDTLAERLHKISATTLQLSLFSW